MNMKDRIIQAAIKCASVHSLTDLRMKHIGAECQTSEANVYRFFDGKDDLLTTCFQVVEQEIGALYRAGSLKNLEKNIGLNEILQLLWERYFHYLLANPEKAVFYFHFRNSNYYTEELRKLDQEYFQDLQEILLELDRKYHIFSRLNPAIWQTYIIDSTSSFAYRILKQEIPDNAQTRFQIFHLIYGGLQSFLS